ncbi:hypothetical protein [Methanobacterium sp.]|uniref:hypothetical protein n=1 Tax=Methanobacterium sp. TaxID=2164 RepID=UPI0025900228|nr:hypothetical protein [Methanobacterium sp.]
MIIRQSSFSPLKHSLSQDYEILTDSIVLFNHIFESLFRENIGKFHFHELMKNEVYNLAKIFNFSSRMEYRVDKKKLDNKRNGFIDVVWFDSDTLVAPIEIDLYGKIKDRFVKFTGKLHGDDEEDFDAHLASEGAGVKVSFHGEGTRPAQRRTSG